MACLAHQAQAAACEVEARPTICARRRYGTAAARFRLAKAVRWALDDLLEELDDACLTSAPALWKTLTATVSPPSESTALCTLPKLPSPIFTKSTRRCSGKEEQVANELGAGARDRARIKPSSQVRCAREVLEPRSEACLQCPDGLMVILALFSSPPSPLLQPPGLSLRCWKGGGCHQV